MRLGLPKFVEIGPGAELPLKAADRYDRPREFLPLVYPRATQDDLVSRSNSAARITADACSLCVGTASSAGLLGRNAEGLCGTAICKCERGPYWCKPEDDLHNGGEWKLRIYKSEAGSIPAAGGT